MSRVNRSQPQPPEHPRKEADASRNLVAESEVASQVGKKNIHPAGQVGKELGQHRVSRNPKNKPITDRVNQICLRFFSSKKVKPNKL